ncbi:MAG: LytR/AlgR family response regulator transcription factor [Myxococcales bacterium]|nr:LytTR family DNA-binding domain-containing protein [Myxococcales bacterium]
MPETVRAAIVEDEPPARLGLRSLLAREPAIVLLHECSDLQHALRALRREPVDLLFLDVELAGHNGFDLLAALGAARPPAVVFVTAFDQHAVRAFEVEAVDYLLKPFDDQRFAQALGRAMERLRLHGAQKLARQLADSLATGGPRPPEGRTVTLRDGARAMFLREEEIDWIEAQDYYVEIHACGAAHLHRETLRDLEARLDPKRFVRIHRSIIVQVDRIRRLQSLPSGDATALLRDGTVLRVSRSRRDAIRALLHLT